MNWYQKRKQRKRALDVLVKWYWVNPDRFERDFKIAFIRQWEEIPATMAATLRPHYTEFDDDPDWVEAMIHASREEKQRAHDRKTAERQVRDKRGAGQ